MRYGSLSLDVNCSHRIALSGSHSMHQYTYKERCLRGCKSNACSATAGVRYDLHQGATYLCVQC